MAELEEGLFVYVSDDRRIGKVASAIGEDIKVSFFHLCDAVYPTEMAVVEPFPKV